MGVPREEFGDIPYSERRLALRLKLHLQGLGGERDPNIK